VEITAAFPAGVIGATLDNLKAAAAGESYEENEMYPGFAATAKQEGFEAVAVAFENIGKAEGFHKKRYEAMAANIQTARSSSGRPRSSGAAATAASSTKARNRRRSARPANIRKPISKSCPKTGRSAHSRGGASPLPGPYRTRGAAPGPCWGESFPPDPLSCFPHWHFVAAQAASVFGCRLGGRALRGPGASCPGRRRRLRPHTRQSMGNGATCQMRSAYSLTARSLEKGPMLAVLRMEARVQASVSR